MHIFENIKFTSAISDVVMMGRLGYCWKPNINDL